MAEHIMKEQSRELIRNHILGLAMCPSPEYTIDDLFSDICWDLNNMKPADVAPIVHGWWIEDDCAFMRCSLCGYENDWEWATPYCPNCGARMDGGKTDAD